MTLHTESVADQTDHFADVFVCENVVYSYDVRKYTADAILFREIQYTKMNNLMFLAAFSVRMGLE